MLCFLFLPTIKGPFPCSAFAIALCFTPLVYSHLKGVILHLLSVLLLMLSNAITKHFPVVLPLRSHLLAQRVASAAG